MHIYTNTCPTLSSSVVALGFFDGVHIGHRELIKKAVAEAHKETSTSVIYTFFEHPRKILFPELDTKCIYTSEEKTRVFKELGADSVVYDSFSDVCDMIPSRFVEEVLVSKLSATFVVCGYNFRFGKDNTGDVDTLRSLLSVYRIPLFVIPPVCAGELPVSSGRIRALIEEGKVDTARLLLTRPYSVTETVVHGHRIGHKLGFPTVNIKIPEGQIAPCRGVYFTKTVYGGNEWISVTNIGVRPTVRDGETQCVCETHIIGFDKDIYGEEIRVEFYRMHRSEEQFESLDKLSCVLKNDVLSAIEYFKNEENK